MDIPETNPRPCGRSLLVAGLAAVAMIGLPLAGVALGGNPVGRYLAFPPTTQYVAHAPFSWPLFLLLATVTLLVVSPFVWRVIRAPAPVVPPPQVRRRFPAWGWLGVGISAVAWLVAWTRLPLFAPLQIFTFSPLWFGYILMVNAWTWRRTGGCMLTDRPRFLIALFVASAGFWWFFEYLNRFVQNWYYVGTGDLTPLRYFIFATLPFATVLPAVMGTEALLRSFPRLDAGLAGFVPVTLRQPRRWAVGWLVVAVAGLAGIGLWPDLLFPMLWLAPLILLTALLTLQGRATLFTPLRMGDWRRLCRLALAALICGFFWELWNVFSAAKWIYAVPYVQRFHLFEMPLLGYAGYLPFGLECAVIADWLSSTINDEQNKKENTPCRP